MNSGAPARVTISACQSPKSDSGAISTAASSAIVTSPSSSITTRTAVPPGATRMSATRPIGTPRNLTELPAVSWPTSRTSTSTRVVPRPKLVPWSQSVPATTTTSAAMMTAPTTSSRPWVIGASPAASCWWRRLMCSRVCHARQLGTPLHETLHDRIVRSAQVVRRADQTDTPIV